MGNEVLSTEGFRLVVDLTPLSSIDLVVKGGDGKLLLGKRLNKPAKGFWFVLGGPVLRNESHFPKLLDADGVHRHSKWYFMNENGYSV